MNRAVELTSVPHQSSTDAITSVRTHSPASDAHVVQATSSSTVTAALTSTSARRHLTCVISCVRIDRALTIASAPMATRRWQIPHTSASTRDIESKLACYSPTTTT